MHGCIHSNKTNKTFSLPCTPSLASPSLSSLLFLSFHSLLFLPRPFVLLFARVSQRQAETHSDSAWNNNWLVKYLGKKAECGSAVSVPLVYMSPSVFVCMCLLKWAAANISNSSLVRTVWMKDWIKAAGKNGNVTCISATFSSHPHICPFLSDSVACISTDHSKVLITWREPCFPRKEAHLELQALSRWIFTTHSFCQLGSQSFSLTVKLTSQHSVIQPVKPKVRQWVSLTS